MCLVSGSFDTISVEMVVFPQAGNPEILSLNGLPVLAISSAANCSAVSTCPPAGYLSPATKPFEFMTVTVIGIGVPIGNGLGKFL
jgi:hypothetical protein